MRTSRYLNEERIQFLMDMDGVPRKDVWQMFNEKYGADIPYRTLIYHMRRLGIKAPDSHFEKGHSPWNKGMERDEYRTHFNDEEWEETIGRVLNAPHHRNKIGDVKIIKNSHGVPEPWIVVRLGKNLTTYQKLQKLDRFIWEHKCGEIPDGWVIIHLNYNTLDCTIDNLAIIRKKWFLEYTRWMRSDHPEINKTTIKWLALRDVLEEKEK